MLAAAATLSACGDATGPSRDTDAPSETLLANGPALGGLIADESARVLPGINGGGGRDELVASLENLTGALQAGLGNESRAALDRFTTAADRFESSVVNPDVAAELSAIRHAVEVVREAVVAK